MFGVTQIINLIIIIFAYKNNLQNQQIFKINKIQCVCHTCLKRLHQFVAIMKVHPNSKKSISSLTAVLLIQLFQSNVHSSRSGRSYPLKETESMWGPSSHVIEMNELAAPADVYPEVKKE